jgi:U4/U6.U5 tri-snRNP-associated protein 1
MPTEIESDSRRQTYRRDDREQRDRRDRGRRDDRRRDRRSRSRSRSGSRHRQRSRSRSDSRSRRQERKVHRPEKTKEPVGKFSKKNLMTKESKHEKNDENQVEAMNEDAPPVPKIEMVANSSGELETSVEQMNILRAKLGLKPLKVESEAEKKQKAEKAKKDEEERTKDRKAIEVKAKIAKAKEEREYKEFVSGKTMGDVLHNQNIYQRQKDSAKKVEQKEKSDHNRQQEQDQLEKLGVKKQDQDQEETEDAASWVLRFRKIQKDKEMAEKREKELEEMEAKIQESATVPGVKVMHNVDDIALKDEVILTLKDDQILEVGKFQENSHRLVEWKLKRRRSRIRKCKYCRTRTNQ